MAEGKYYDESGDFDEARDFDNLDNYSEENQAYARNNSGIRLNGRSLDDNKTPAGFGGFGKKKDSDGKQRWGLLKKGEEDASKKPNINGKGGDKKASLGEKENNVESDDSTAGKIKNAVQGVKDLKSGKIKSGKGRLKKAGPLLATLALVAGFGGASFFGQMSMPFSLMSVLQGNFDSIGVSNVSRTTRFLKWQLSPKSRKVSNAADDYVKKHSKIYQKFTGANEDYFSISRKQARKLKKAGIEVSKLDDDSGEKVLKFTRGDGEVSTVTAKDFKETLKSDPEFSAKFEEGSKTWRKSVSDWFDDLAGKFLDKIKVARNRFKDYRKNRDQAKNKEQFEGEVKKATGDADIGGKTGDASLEETETKTKDGGTKVETEVKNDGESELNIKRGSSPDEVKTKVKDFSEGVGGKLSKVASKLAQTGCMAAEIVGAINMLVLASEATQILQVASTVFEGIQKAQVGDSTGTPISEIGNSLTQNKKTTYNTKDGNKVEKNGSAMSAAAIGALYGNTATNTNDASINSFNLMDSIDTIMGAIGSGMEAYKTCTFAKIGAGLIEAGLDLADAATDVGAIVACIGGAVVTAGASCAGVVAKAVVKIAVGMTFSALIGKVVEHIVSSLVPKIATMIARDLATDIGGEDFGNAIASGANMYMGQNHQYGGGSVATKSTLMAYLKEQEEYNAEIARYERQNRSPFDVTSQYTFLGSLLARSVPLLTQTSSITSGIMNFGNMANNAIASLVPQASAMQSAITAQEAANNTEKRCPELGSIGAVGDPFCNPYFITDFTTMDEDPAEVAYKVSKLNIDNFDQSNEDEDVPVIKEDAKDSDLYRYIVYCGQRSATTFGMADQNIANAIDSGAGTIESAIPVWGGIADMMQGTNIMKNIGLVSGEACVTQNSGEGLGSKTFKWEDAKYYQRFIEDQRMAENMGLVEESSVSVALRHYYEKNPIDDSFEGILAYYSGMSKEKVSDTLDFIEAVTWIAGYDPSELYPVNGKEVEVSENNNEVIEHKYEKINDLFVLPKIARFAYRKEYMIG